jgi:peptidoglycan/xylan/chitin deacetylase (PgdA/CDA1 family)
VEEKAEGSLKPFTTLLYHRIALDPADPLAVGPGRLEAQLDWLARGGYAGVGLDAALRAEAAGPHRRRVALTFDDGTLDFAAQAWPRLRARGFGATLFVVTGRVGGTADWPGAAGAPLLDWPALRALQAEGVEIGAHAHTHCALDTLPPEAAQAELRAAFEALAEQLGAPRGLSYPYGRATPVLARAAAAAGYAWAATARGGRSGPGTPRHRLRRTLVFGADGTARFGLKVRLGYARWVEARMDLRGVP